MKVIIEDLKPGEEEFILIKCKEMDASILRFINRFRQENLKITAMKDGSVYRLDPKEVYYFESMENKTFVYTQSQVFETKLKLYEIEKDFCEVNFLRVSKSVILNMDKIKSLKPAFSARLEALLKNGEKVIISRQYVSKLKEVLGL